MPAWLTGVLLGLVCLGGGITFQVWRAGGFANTALGEWLNEPEEGE